MSAGVVSIQSFDWAPTIKGRKLKVPPLTLTFVPHIKATINPTFVCDKFCSLYDLQDNVNPRSPVDHIGLEDYRPIDPVPSSKATIRPKPIQHGSPLIPYIPKPPPAGMSNLGV